MRPAGAKFFHADSDTQTDGRTDRQTDFIANLMH